ncbi:MAG TPA: IclR family transcriptional regulator C-terminal domain-containing protein, partial [Jiangellaceae bacterium]|nr:IclR family transcriptional regulator C-terminal domain-containing protein [Jiangellaceae bacterium]
SSRSARQDDRRWSPTSACGCPLISPRAGGRYSPRCRPPRCGGLFPDAAAFVDRHGTGPSSPTALRSVLSKTRQQGYADEDGEVTPGLASVAAAVLDHNRLPIASVAVTYQQRESAPGNRERYAAAVTRTAADISRRVSPTLR